MWRERKFRQLMKIYGVRAWAIRTMIWSWSHSISLWNPIKQQTKSETRQEKSKREKCSTSPKNRIQSRARAEKRSRKTRIFRTFLILESASTRPSGNISATKAVLRRLAKMYTQTRAAAAWSNIMREMGKNIWTNETESCAEKVDSAIVKTYKELEVGISHTD